MTYQFFIYKCKKVAAHVCLVSRSEPDMDKCVPGETGRIVVRKDLQQRGCGQEGEEEEGSRALVFTWGNSGEAAVLLEVPAPSGVCSARLQAGPRAAFCCSGTAGRKELWHGRSWNTGRSTH